MKRLLSMLLAIVMLLSMLPTAGFAEATDSKQLIDESAQMSDESSQSSDEPSNPVPENAGASEDGDENPVEEEPTDSDISEDEEFNLAGCGSEESPYEIDSEAGLRFLAEQVNAGSGDYAGAFYILTSDISLSAAWTPIGSGEHPFTGSFDGNGKRLSGLSAGDGNGYFGLFGAANGARISRIALDSVSVEAAGYDVIGAIVGYMQGGSLSESYVSGTVNGGTGEYCGGLVGCAEGAEISNCFSTVEMTAEGYTGGIAGYGCDGTTISHCYNIGFIYSTVKGSFGSVLGNESESIDLSSCFCIDTTDKGARFLTRKAAADADSFEGFDFDGVWYVDKESAYPYPVLKAVACQCDAKWAPDTTVYPTGYVEYEERYTPQSKNALLESEAKDEDLNASSYIIPNLPEARNQSPYGTCWAHSMIAAAETNMIKKGYADSSINLSELQFVWFHHAGTKNAAGEYEDPLNNFGGDHNYSYGTSYGYWGGDNYYAASMSMASWIGPTAEDDTTAYSKANAEAIVANNGLDYSYAFSKDAVHLESAKRIPTSAGIEAVKKALLKYGAVCFSYMSDDGYDTYGGKYYYSAVGTTTDHAVCIVGWDDSVNKNLFYDSNNDATPKNDGAWIVRNSWGSGWGYSGMFYMSYESTFVSTSTKPFFVYDYEPAGSYGKCYQYDGSSAYVYGSGFETASPSVANIFTASGNDKLSAVSFWMEDNADLDYTVKVYTNLTDGSNPTSGTLAATVSGQTDYVGYYTVPLPKQVSVSSGSKFSVVLTINNPSGATIYFPYDKYKYYNDYDIYYAYSQAGQSFYSASGKSWTDKSANNGGNYRIKAFTADNTEDPRPIAPTVSVSTANSSMVLSWNAVSNAASYTVYRSITPDGTYSNIGTTTAAGYTDATAVRGTVYYYKVTASTAGGNTSRDSNTVSGLIGTQTSFIITYDANGGSSVPAYQIKTAGNSLTLSEELPCYKGRSFLGWSENASAKAAEYAPGDDFTKDADTTLYAVWADGILVNSPTEIETEHKYPNSANLKWCYYNANAISISLTFDSNTKTEEKYDFIYIFDGDYKLIGKYSGTELAGQTVTIPGDTVIIQLTSDSSVNYYGIKISSYQITENVKYTVKFVNHDGTELQSSDWSAGATPSYTGTTPTKTSTAQYSYTFKGWSPEIAAVTGDVTYTAQFTEATRQYTVTFKNDNGTVLQSSPWNYGTTPSYSGTTPTKTSTAQYNYTFKGWSPAISTVTGDATYTAQFNSATRQYTVTFKNYDDTVLSSSSLDYGATPSYSGTPSRAADTGYTYTFKGWSPAITTVTGNATYKAEFNAAPKQYTITFKNHDGTELQSSAWNYGTTPSYSGTTPTKPSTAQYSYTFKGWSPAISTVTGAATYTAQFNETVRQYTVTFKNHDGSVLKSSAWNYGATPSYSGTTPTKTADSSYTYTFSGWSPAITAVTGDATYTAQFNATAKPVQATSISVSPSSVKMYKGGQKLQLTVTAQPANASNACTWKSSNTLVATVDSNGVVTSKSFTGSATITATASDGSKKTAKCTVKVVKPVTGLTLTAPTTTVYPGQQIQFSTSITPSTAPDTIEWSFSASDSLRPYISLSNGKLSVSSDMPGECAGPVTVYAKATGCSSPITKSVTVNVTVGITSMTMYADGVLVSSGSGELWVGEKSSMQLSVVILPSNASQSVTWKSSNTAAATVDGSGRVTAVAGGSATITATSADGTKSVSYGITVKEWASSVTVSASGTTLTKGSSLTPTATVLPATATNRNVRWEISPASDNISFDSSTGKITVSDSWNGSPSSVTLTAYALGAKTDTVCGSVTVSITASVSKATSVTIYTPAGKSASSATIKLSGGTQKFTAKVSPSDANQTVTWSSSNTKVAKVDQNGNITPVKKGLCTIKVKTTDGSNKTDSILITVSK